MAKKSYYNIVALNEKQEKLRLRIDNASFLRNVREETRLGMIPAINVAINKTFFDSRHLLFLSQNNGLVHQNKRSAFANLDQTVILGKEKQ